jgi:hypothetical protein
MMVAIAVKVIHGANVGEFYLPARTPVSAVRESLIDVFNIPSSAIQFVNGERTLDNRRLESNDTLEFVVPWGLKGTGSHNEQPKLPLTSHGDIDITDGVPEGFIHVDLPRLGPTCKRIGIEYGKAIVGWSDIGRKFNKKHYPLFSGVVIRLVDHSRLMVAVEDKARRRQKIVDRLPVLAALFTLNRRAKRCRDLAQTYYESGMHGLAGDMKREKNQIYDLKGQVLHYMVEAGALIGRKYHRFEFGNWAEVLEGGGYRFHRPCPPQESPSEAELIESLEAKPKEAHEPTLEIAYEVVNKFLQERSRVSVYNWPPVVRSSRRFHWRDEEDEDDDFEDY